MKRLKMTIRMAALAAAITLAGCSALEIDYGGDVLPEALPMEYDQLYNCLWTVADMADSGSLPGAFADPEGALMFRPDDSMLHTFSRRDDAMAAGDQSVYAMKERYSFSIDTGSNTLIVTGEGLDCHFRIERLNDRTMTLCYRNDRNEYVAYLRTSLENAIITAE